MRTRIAITLCAAAILLAAVGAGWALRDADDGAPAADPSVHAPPATHDVSASSGAQTDLQSADEAAGRAPGTTTPVRADSALTIDEPIPSAHAEGDYPARQSADIRTRNIESYFGDFITEKFTSVRWSNGCESVWQVLARMDQEPLDDQWAVPMEQRLRSMWTANGPSPLDGVLSIQCRTAVCQVSTLLDADAENWEGYWAEFMRRFRSDAVAGEFPSHTYSVLSPPSDRQHKVVVLVLKRANRHEDPDPAHCRH